jgi:hypothetical protein
MGGVVTLHGVVGLDMPKSVHKLVFLFDIIYNFQFSEKKIQVGIFPVSR